MITRIALENFLSYESVDVSFYGSTFAVVGDNGMGKSAFLESIPYAYYGVGREDKLGMSRIHGDGSHRVDIWDDHDICVTRGRKASGAGFTEVHNGDNLLAKGAEADAWIANYLKMDVDTFMLTSFFGLGDSYTDKLLHVLPAARLEALQNLAQVGPYNKFLAKAKDGCANAEKVGAAEAARKDGAEAVLNSSLSLSDELVVCEKLIEKADAKVDALKKVRADLQVEENAYLTLVKEKERLLVERKGLTDNLNDYQTDINEYNATIASETEALKVNRQSLKEYTALIKAKDVTGLDEKIESIKESITVKKTTAQLKNVASRLSGKVAKCPLCDQDITKDIIASWESAVAELNAEVVSLSKSLESSQSALKSYQDTTSLIEDLNDQISDSLENVGAAKKSIADTTTLLSQCKADLLHKDSRFDVVSEKLGLEYQGLLQKINNVLADIDKCQEEKHTHAGAAVQMRESIKRSDAAKKIVAESDKLIQRSALDIAAFSLLKSAWNRYGIPLQLVNRLAVRIEERASAVYKEFDNGHIEVREVEDRGKPGIQFFLVDQKGSRTFGQLSMGEKIMFFISVRVAVAQIIAEDSAINVDFLVLDEAMGNLSPKSRDNLVRLVNKSLRKIFPQLILVTHTVIPEIFDRSIEVTMKDSVSSIRVL